MNRERLISQASPADPSVSVDRTGLSSHEPLSKVRKYVVYLRHDRCAKHHVHNNGVTNLTSSDKHLPSSLTTPE